MRLQLLDRQQAIALVVDLQRGVLDMEGVVAERVHCSPGGVAIVVFVDEDVGGEGGEPGCEFPDVEVVSVTP